MKNFSNFMMPLFVSVLAIICFSGCMSRDRIVLFQDADQYLDAKRIASTYDIRIQVDDRLSIAIASQDKELVDVFNNKTVIGSSAGGGSVSGASGAGSSANAQQSFHVDNDGYIEFPVFGKIYVEGLSRKAVADTIQNRLRSGYVNDAVVTVELLSFHVVVVGGTGQESILTIDKDRCTIIEALTMAGGFKAGAYRENVLVVREENGEVWTYRVNFTELGSLLNSPVYYLQQNDIVYIEPGASQQLDEGSGMKYLSMVSSVIAFAVSIAAIMFSVF